MKKKIINIALSFLTVVGMFAIFSIVGGVPQASAAFTSCPIGLFCAYDGHDGNGTRWTLAFSTNGPPGTCRDIAPARINKWSSVINAYGNGDGKSYRMLLYSSARCNVNSPVIILVSNGQALNLYGAADNNIESFMILNP